MAGGESRFTIIGLLKDMEDTARQLYEVYAGKFPDKKDFWMGLSEDERNHVGIVHNIGSEIAQGDARFVDDKFKAEQIHNDLGWAKERLAEARGSDLSLKKALSTAFQLEDSLVEKEYFGIMEGATHDIRQFFQYLSEASKKHREKIRALLEKEGG